MNVQNAIETYNENFNSLLSHEGEYIILYGDKQFEGYWKSYDDALKAGYEQFGLEPFFVKKIEREESAHYFTRGVISGTIDSEDYEARHNH